MKEFLQKNGVWVAVGVVVVVVALWFTGTLKSIGVPGVAAFDAPQQSISAIIPATVTESGTPGTTVGTPSNDNAVNITPTN